MTVGSPSQGILKPGQLAEAWNDQRIVRGMQRQFQMRQEMLASGGKSLGWKLAFGGPEAMQRLRIKAPLVGFLMADAVVSSGSVVRINAWQKPAAEPELALYLGLDIPGDASREMIARSIAGVGPAIELADVDHPSDDVEGTLARNIYQRHVILGHRDNMRAGAAIAGLKAKVLHNAKEIADTEDLTLLTGDLISIVAHVARLLRVFGESLRAGELIIAGSITSPIWVRAGDSVAFELQPLPQISVKLQNAA